MSQCLQSLLQDRGAVRFQKLSETDDVQIDNFKSKDCATSPGTERYILGVNQVLPQAMFHSQTFSPPHIAIDLPSPYHQAERQVMVLTQPV